MTSKKLFYHLLQIFAEKTAMKAGNLLVLEQTKATVVKNKDKRDIATSADYHSERLIISEIEKEFPKHNIFSEEAGLISKASAYTWVIDPLDSTKEYAVGLPTFGVLITCETKTKLVAGCTNFPKTQELFSASAGNGAFEGKRKLKVSEQPNLTQAIIYTHLPNNKLKEPHFSPAWRKTSQVAKAAYRIRGTYLDCLALCYVAKGAIEGYFVLFDRGPKWHDLAAGIITLQEAGGKVTDLKGNQLKLGDLRKGLVASNGLIHDELLKVINQQN